MKVQTIIFTIMVLIGALMASQPVGTNFDVSVSDISDNDIGTVRASCTNNGDGTFHITMDTTTMNTPNWKVVMMHEIGHVNNWNGSEEDADNFANAQGVGYIHDASY
jgi:membrane-bound ClpP family serine protease